MGFRDELEAARARIESLEREVIASRPNPRHKPVPPDVLAAGGLGLVLALLASLLAAGWMWQRWTETERALADARRDGGLARAAQHDCAEVLEQWTSTATPAGAIVRAVTDRQVRWYGRGEFDETWTATVTERIGAAPASVGQTCTGRFTRSDVARGPESPFTCELRITCGELVVYPRPGEAAAVECYLDQDGGIHSLGPFERTATRARGTRGLMRVDDGPAGTWALAFEALEP